METSFFDKEQFPKKLRRSFHWSWAKSALFKSTLQDSHSKVVEETIKEFEKSGKKAEIRAVDRIKNLSKADFIKNYFDKNLPVVFEGGAKDWQCYKEWDFDYFANQVGDAKTLMVDAEGLTGYSTKGDYDLIELKELIENIKGGGKKYLRFSPLINKNKKLQESINLNWLRGMRTKDCIGEGFQMFIGPGGTETPLHNNVTCNLFVMIRGQKHWRLYPTHATSILRPNPSRGIFQSSPFNFRQPDFDKYPLAKYLDGYDAFLEPGDIMYIPPHMWHHVVNTTPSIAFGYRYNCYRNALKSSKTLTLMRALANDPPLWRSFIYDLTDINLVWAYSLGKHKEVSQRVAKFKPKADDHPH